MHKQLQDQSMKKKPQLFSFSSKGKEKKFSRPHSSKWGPCLATAALHRLWFNLPDCSLPFSCGNAFLKQAPGKNSPLLPCRRCWLGRCLCRMGP